MAERIPEEIMQLMAARFRMLCDASRLAILHALMDGEQNVTQLVEATGRGKTNVSKHLKLMTDSGILGRRKVGLQVFYRLQDPVIRKICNVVCRQITGLAAKKLQLPGQRPKSKK